MTVFDFIVLILIGASVLAGALRGFVRALIASGALLAGVILASHGYMEAGAALRALGLVESAAAANASGFLLIAGAALVLGLILGEMARGSLRRAHFGWLDRALGAAFGFFRGFAVCSILYLALTAFPVRLGAVAEARTAPALAVGARLLAELVSADVRTRFLDYYRRVTI